jgi:hypothetical protein
MYDEDVIVNFICMTKMTPSIKEQMYNEDVIVNVICMTKQI